MRLTRKIRLVADISSIITSLAVLALVAIIGVNILKRDFVKQNSTKVSDVSVKAGEQFPLHDFNWAGNSETVVLAVRKDCGFCRASAPFYRKLARRLEARKDIALLAVSPDTSDESRQYLHDIDVPVADVRQEALKPLGVNGTPTLILVDKSGAVRNVWVGKWAEEQEEKIIEAILNS